MPISAYFYYPPIRLLVYFPLFFLSFLSTFLLLFISLQDKEILIHGILKNMETVKHDTVKQSSFTDKEIDKRKTWICAPQWREWFYPFLCAFIP